MKHQAGQRGALQASFVLALTFGSSSFAFEQRVVQPWTATDDAHACQLTTKIAIDGRGVELSFEWSRDAGTAFKVMKRNFRAPSPDYRIEAGGARTIAANTADTAPALLRLVASNAAWSVLVDDGTEPQRADVPVDGGIAAAMFLACVDGHVHATPLSEEKQRAIVYGPVTAPSGMDAPAIPPGCRLAGRFLASPRPFQFELDVTGTAAKLRIAYEAVFGAKTAPDVTVDLRELGGPTAPMADEVRFTIPPDRLAALRADVTAGNARTILVLEKGNIVGQLGFGMLVNEPVVRMFDACVGARFGNRPVSAGS